MPYNRPKRLYYRTAQLASWFVATFVFKRKFLRNEIKGKQGSFVVIANHEAALDFVNLIGATRRPMSFVISKSFFNTLPIKGFMEKMGVIPKQQFQTAVKDLRQIKAVVDEGEAVVIYPAGLMCEDGLSTPIPTATYKFLKWLEADIYVARTIGTYFVTPKWAKGMRPGRTYMDIYKLFSKEELAQTDLAMIREKTDRALLFDAYREQEEWLVKYKGNDNIEGLQNVLYICPHCLTDFSMQVRDKNTLLCTACGFMQKSDEYAFLHKCGDVGQEWRYVSDWSRCIYEHLRERIRQGLDGELTAETAIHMIDYEKNKFTEVGQGILRLSQDRFSISGYIKGEAVQLEIPTTNLPSLPFSPGKYLEIQHGSNIYRCVLNNGRLVMKFIHMVKIFYELKNRTALEAEKKTVKQ